VENLYRVGRARQHDLVFLQRNLTATLATWESLLRPPVIFDVDDAIFVGQRGSSAGRIARNAAMTICGNRFLADYFSDYSKVVVLPTAVDDELFTPAKMPYGKAVIGWSGSSSGLSYLYAVEEAIDQILRRIDGAVLKVVSDQPPRFSRIHPEKVIFERWRPERQVESLREFSVGLMPLEDSVWARGKCSYKMLTYMAVGIPVVVSPVGMNVEVLAHGVAGYSAATLDDWVGALETILTDVSLAESMGAVGRSIVESKYSRRVIAPQLIDVLRGVLR
jgi:glycosyltransferase involved in cell wall biosynthesis